MTVCGAGTGVPKAGFAALQYVGPGAIGGALAGLAGWEGALVGAAIGALSYELSTFCPDGPPAMPTFDVFDIEKILSPFPLPGQAASIQKFNDFMGNILWPVFCQCSGGASTIPSPSAFPSGAPTHYTAPLVNTTPCLAQSTTQVGFPSGSVTYRWLPSPPSVRTGLNESQPLPSGATAVRIDSSFSSEPGTSLQLNASIVFYDTDLSTAAPFSSQTIPPTLPGSTQSVTYPVPAAAQRFQVNVVKAISGGAAVPNTGTLSATFYCGGAPGAVLSPCCPPDPNTQALLERLLGMVTLIQRQAAPFSYVYGTNHAALSGNGSFAVSDLLGVSVDVTTLPANYGSAVGTPVFLFDIGWVSLGTSDGYEVKRRIDSDGSLFLPNSAGVYTSVGYTLSPGVVVSIRELVREP